MLKIKKLNVIGIIVFSLLDTGQIIKREEDSN